MSYKNSEIQKEFQHSHYIKYKETFRNRQRARRQRYREIIHEAKNKPCTDCGGQYPYYVMELDHLVDKIDNLARMSNFSSDKKLIEEIAKCEVVCSNCHKQRTYVRSKNASMVELADTQDLNPCGESRESATLS